MGTLNKPTFRSGVCQIDLNSLTHEDTDGPHIGDVGRAQGIQPSVLRCQGGRSEGTEHQLFFHPDHETTLSEEDLTCLLMDLSRSPQQCWLYHACIAVGTCQVKLLTLAKGKFVDSDSKLGRQIREAKLALSVILFHGTKKRALVRFLGEDQATLLYSSLEILASPS